MRGVYFHEYDYCLIFETSNELINIYFFTFKIDTFRQCDPITSVYIETF